VKTLELEAGKPLSFSLEVEVLPTFELPSFESMRSRSQRWKSPKSTSRMSSSDSSDARNGREDRIRLQGRRSAAGYATVVRNDEKSRSSAKDNVLVVVPAPKKRPRTGAWPDDRRPARHAERDKKIGDTRRFPPSRPEMHEREDIRGAQAQECNTKSASPSASSCTPAIVAERYGLPNEDILREQIKLGLENRRDEEQASAMREQVIEQLAEEIKGGFAGETLGAAGRATPLAVMRLHCLYQGISTEEVERTPAERRSDSERWRAMGSKRFFLLHRLGEH
jgi:hypothetical protein